MADTGAPWNLPYPLPTDLVRDGADAIKDLAEATAAGLDLAGDPGIGSNVVQTVLTAPFSASVAQGAVSSDAISVTITPSSATAKVLVIASVSLGAASGTSGVFAELYAGGSVTSFRGDADGSRSRRSTGASVVANTGSQQSTVITFLDSPGVATAVTYSVRIGHNDSSTQTLYLNRAVQDSNSSQFARTASSLTAIEVAA